MNKRRRKIIIERIKKKNHFVSSYPVNNKCPMFHPPIVHFDMILYIHNIYIYICIDESCDINIIIRLLHLNSTSLTSFPSPLPTITSKNTFLYFNLLSQTALSSPGSPTIMHSGVSDIKGFIKQVRNQKQFSTILRLDTHTQTDQENK